MTGLRLAKTQEQKEKLYLGQLSMSPNTAKSKHVNKRQMSISFHGRRNIKRPTSEIGSILFSSLKAESKHNNNFTSSFNSSSGKVVIPSHQFGKTAKLSLNNNTGNQSFNVTRKNSADNKVSSKNQALASSMQVLEQVRCQNII